MTTSPTLTPDLLTQRYRALMAQAKALAEQRAAVLDEAAVLARAAGIPHETRAGRERLRFEQRRASSEEGRYGHE